MSHRVLTSSFRKFIYILYLIYLSIILAIIAKTPPSSGFEISIYAAYPLFFWLLIIANISCSIAILVHQSFKHRDTDFWIVPFLAIITTNFIIMLLPLFRGYFVSDLGDELTHLGILRYIALTGDIGAKNYYPLNYVLSSSLAYFTNLSFEDIIKIIPSIFYLIYILGLYILARVISKNVGEKILIMTFASILLYTYFNIFYLPTQFFLFLLPTILYIYFTNLLFVKNIYYSLLLIIILLPMPFLHPLGTMFLVISFLILGFLFIIDRYDFPIRLSKFGNYINYDLSHVLRPAMILSIVLFVWFSVFSLFHSTVRRSVDWFLYGIGTSPTIALAEQAQMAKLTLFDIIVLVIKTYGHVVLFSILTIIAIIIILRDIILRRSNHSIITKFFSLFFIAFGFIYLQTLAGDFVGTGRSIRIYCWPLLASILLNGLIYHKTIITIKAKKLRMLCLIILTTLIIISSIIGVFSVYMSPNINLPNSHTTTMDLIGVLWFFEYKNNDETILSIDLLSRYIDYIYGLDRNIPREIIKFRLKSLINISAPAHLGYDKNLTMAETMRLDTYIIINKLIRDSKSYLWPNVGLFTLNDLNNLSSDSSVGKIYYNGEFEIWRVMVPVDQRL